MTYPLEELLKENQEYEWIDERVVSLDILKTKLVKPPILRFPNWSIKFHAHIDAYRIEIGAILSQQGDDGMDHPNTYSSRMLKKVERNYLTTKREALGMVFILQNYRHYLLVNPFVFFTYPQELKYLVNIPLNHERIF